MLAVMQSPDSSEPSFNLAMSSNAVGLQGRVRTTLPAGGGMMESLQGFHPVPFPSSRVLLSEFADVYAWFRWVLYQ